MLYMYIFIFLLVTMTPCTATDITYCKNCNNDSS